MAVLILLSHITGASNFCSNLFLPFLSTVRILSSEAILFQIHLHALFPRFPWSTLLYFPSCFNIHNLMIWELMFPRMASSYHLRQLWIISSIFTTTPTLSRGTSVDTLSTSHPTHHSDHTTLHLTKPRLICNSKFPHLV